MNTKHLTRWLSAATFITAMLFLTLPAQGALIAEALALTGAEEAAIEAGEAAKGLGGAKKLFILFGGKAGFSEASPEPEVVLGKIVQGAMVVIGVVFGVLVVYGGYLWMTARGNEETVKKAIGILQTATIGLIIVVGAYAITSFIVDKVISAAYQIPAP